MHLSVFYSIKNGALMEAYVTNHFKACTYVILISAMHKIQHINKLI